MEQLEAEYKKIDAESPYGTVADELGESLGQDPQRIKCVRSFAPPHQQVATDRLRSLICGTSFVRGRKWFDNKRQSERRIPRSRSAGRSRSRSRSASAGRGSSRSTSTSPSAIAKRSAAPKKSPRTQRSRSRGGRVGYTTATLNRSEMLGKPTPPRFKASTADGGSEAPEESSTSSTPTKLQGSSAPTRTQEDYGLYTLFACAYLCPLQLCLR